MRRTITYRHWAPPLCLVKAASVLAVGAIQVQAGILPCSVLGELFSPKAVTQNTSATPATGTAQTGTTGAIQPGSIHSFLVQLRTGAAMNNAELKKLAAAAGVKVTLVKRLPGNEYTIQLNPGVTNAGINAMVARLEGDSNVLSAEALTSSSGVINGQLRTLHLSSDAGQVYSIYVPKKGGANAPILVAVGNGTSQIVGQKGDGAAMAEKYGAVIIIPQFAPNRFANYGILDPHDNAGGADIMLDKIVAEAGKMAGANTGKIYLLGYGTGGGFAHRYAMAHPDLTAGVVVVNTPGFTMTDTTLAYPAGIKLGTLPPGLTMDPTQFLRVPALAMATKLASSSATPGKNNLSGYSNWLPYYLGLPFTLGQQGSNLQGNNKKGNKVPPGLLQKAAPAPVNVLANRAQAWINAMNAAAKAQNLSTQYAYQLISYCPGANCIGHDGVADAFSFLFNGKAPVTPAPIGHTLTANAGASQTVTAGSPVTLQGAAQQTGTPSTILVSQWIQVGGPIVALSGANTPTATFTAPTTTSTSSIGVILTFKYTVIDSLGYTRSAYTHVTVKPAATGTTGGTTGTPGSTAGTSGSTTGTSGGSTSTPGSTTGTSGGTTGTSGGTTDTSGNTPLMGTVVQGRTPVHFLPALNNR